MPVSEPVAAQPVWAPRSERSGGWRSGWVVVAVAVVVALVAVVGVTVWALGGRDAESTAGPAGPAAPVIISVPTVLILDASGSMTQADAPGPRIDAAKAAAQGLVDALPDDATIGLTTYGTGTGSTEAEHDEGCTDVRTPIPLSWLNRDQMRDGIAGLRASGYTPISLALRTAVAQLPADDSAQAIVLVSDGEDTCGQPPCDEAAQVKRTHPNLAISTVGFKTDGPASDQLRCIATATGGLFVIAANASQLAARLLATQNIGAAETALSSDGLGGVRLGEAWTDIRAAHPDFPDASTSGRVVVVWRDCDFGFVNGSLDSIVPHDGGHTIDGVRPGTPLSRATELYGNPLAAMDNGDGSRSVLYTADPATPNAYRILVHGYADAGGTISGTVKTIILCRCAPHASANPTRPSGVTDDTIRSMTFPAATCGNGSTGWDNTVPITVTNGEGEARTAAGQFGGASIRDAKLAGWLDANADGTEDAVVTFVCFGSTFDMCCAGRTSMMEFVGVFDFSTPTSPRPVGETIMPGTSPVRGETYGEPRSIDQVRIDDSAVITDEKLVYPDTSGATADLGYSPYATIEVTHRFADGRWTSTERVR
ncbi:MAG: von Willebrand factor type [Mycobacterium sp.]|nr:von Willebrand factor type [Mycobacterium sp.]